MTRDEIIRMARDAVWIEWNGGEGVCTVPHGSDLHLLHKDGTKSIIPPSISEECHPYKKRIWDVINLDETVKAYMYIQNPKE